MAEKIWSATFIGEDVIFRQGDQSLRIPLKELHPEMVKEIKDGHTCGGCRDLPLNGYRSDKYSWCSFSRCIANCWEGGYRWISDDPPLRYLAIVTQLSLVEPMVRMQQTYYLMKVSKKGLEQRLNSIKRAVLEQINSKEDHLYELGDIPHDLQSEDGSFRRQVKCGDVMKDVIVPNVNEFIVILDDFTSFCLSVVELDDDEGITICL
jgi:hypothetical protein